MNPLRTQHLGWIMCICCLICLFTSCSSARATVVSVGTSMRPPLGTTLFTFHSPSTHDDMYAVAWSPDGSRIASGSWDTTVQIWNVSSGHTMLIYHGHTDIVLALAWSPDGTQIASASDDVRVWQAS